MSDGVTLYADHYYPPQPGTAPTLLMRQPYGRDIASTVVYAHPAWFASHGYHVVIQDVRGRGDSEGEFYPFRHEGRDGAETIAALRRRPESNGRVGMYGFSYQGITQLLAAAEQPEGLVCIAPAMTAHDLYHGWFYQGGALRLASTLGWGLQMLRADAIRLRLHGASERLERAWASLSAQYLTTPYGGHPAVTDDELPGYLRDWLERDSAGNYWSSMDVSQSVDKIQVPALHISGWYDTYLKGSIEGFLAMSTQAGTAHARDHQYLVAGPWIHIPWGNRIGTQNLGSAAVVDTDALLLRWCNHWLKGTAEYAAEPRIRHYALHQDRWHSARDFAPPTYMLYLHSGGRANSSKGDGALTTLPPEGSEPPDLFIFDPDVPVSAPGGLAAAPGPTNQANLELGNNLLVYTSAPLDVAMHIFGSAELFVHVSSSASEVDLVVKMVKVQQNGDASFISIGVARSRHVFGTTYSADTLKEWRISLDHTSCYLAPDDRLRIEVASSAYPLYDRNPGTSVAPRFANPSNWRRSTQIIHHSASHVSALHLPLIAPSAGRADLI
jgi:putative CocE/NonD family hydrolase